MDDPCAGGGRYPWTRCVGSWPVLNYDPSRTSAFIRQVYDDYVPPGAAATHGLNWEGNVSDKYIGRPRVQGKYMPVEILWDPIIGVRNWYHEWRYMNTYTDTEKGRDKATRQCRGMGYSFFVANVGCAVFKTGHVSSYWGADFPNGGTADANNTETPLRWATNSRTLNTSHKPSSWLGACNMAGNEWVSHFGARQAAPNIFRFNVIHIDGHIDDSAWRSVKVCAETGHPFNLGVSQPYGYSYAAYYQGGIRKIPNFDGAVDDNL